MEKLKKSVIAFRSVSFVRFPPSFEALQFELLNFKAKSFFFFFFLCGNEEDFVMTNKQLKLVCNALKKFSSFPCFLFLYFGIDFALRQDIFLDIDNVFEMKIV